MTTSGSDPIYLHNDWLSRARFSTFDQTASGSTPYTGQSLTAILTLTPSGAAIQPALSVAMTEGAPGDYSARIAAAFLAAYLAPYVGTIIYERVVSADGAVDVARSLLVVDQRYGG